MGTWYDNTGGNMTFLSDGTITSSSMGISVSCGTWEIEDDMLVLYFRTDDYSDKLVGPVSRNYRLTDNKLVIMSEDGEIINILYRR